MSQTPPPPAPPPPSPDFVDPPAGAVQAGSKALAITSMVLGISGLAMCILAPLGILLGLAAVVTASIALTQRKPGKAQALSGVICGALAILLSIGMVLALLPALGQARRVAKMTTSMVNAQQIGMGLMMYCSDYKDQLPEPGADLSRRLSRYVQSQAIFESPNDRTVTPGYIYVPRGRISRADPADVLLYENPAVPALKWAVVYVDGHVEAKSKAELEALIAGLSKAGGGK